MNNPYHDWLVTEDPMHQIIPDEEMIHTSFQRSFQNKEKINLVGHPANYLKYADNHNLFTEVIL